MYARPASWASGIGGWGIIETLAEKRALLKETGFCDAAAFREKVLFRLPKGFRVACFQEVLLPGFWRAGFLFTVLPMRQDASPTIG